MTMQYAELSWQIIDGIDVPTSLQFGDVYFSKDNGLLETRHVFLNGNDLPERIAQLQPNSYFCVGETGFGTGLNFLALWQLWRQNRPHTNCRLHFISVEKYPLRHADLQRALKAWPELAALSAQLLSQYPYALPGCHRLVFAEDGLSLDLWLGDAIDIFPNLVKSHAVNAWFLDGFSPSCNPELWQKQMIDHLVRLSGAGTTFSSFSVAGVLKQALQAHGVMLERPRGFRHKRQMLKARLTNAPEHRAMQDHEHNSVITPPHIDNGYSQTNSPQNSPLQNNQAQNNCSAPETIAVVGAGIAGLNTAWALAQRGHQVLLLDAIAPLAGASGNPVALLNPKLSSVAKSADHLMTLAWQYALRFYPRFQGYTALTVDQLLLKPNDPSWQLATQYPQDMLQAKLATDSALKTIYPSLQLKQAGCIRPHLFAAHVLVHPRIQYQQAQLLRVEEHHEKVALFVAQIAQDSADINTVDPTYNVDRVVLCCARQNHKLIANYPTLRAIGGQVSWCDIPHGLKMGQAYSYGGYALPQHATRLLMGASFHPDCDDDTVLSADHQHNLDLLQQVFPDLAAQLPEISTWQGRASVRAQTHDYLPIVGADAQSKRVFSMAGMGSKGFLFAPLCSEVLCAIMFNEAYPVSVQLLQQLLPERFTKKIKLKKPYFQAMSPTDQPTSLKS